MRTQLPKYCSMFRDRHGKPRVKFRKGNVSTYIIARPILGDDFMREYFALLEDKDSRTQQPIAVNRTVPGSFDDLIVRYYSSPGWKSLRSTTQGPYQRTIESFREQHGTKPVAKIERRHIQKIVDRKSDTPGAANKLLSAIRILLAYAIRIGMRDDNPAIFVEKVPYKPRGFQEWSEAEIQQFETAFRIGTPERLAFSLLLFTGQRRSDVVKMGPQHVRNGLISVEQQKTGARLQIPIHPELADVLAKTEVGDLTFLKSRLGKPYSPQGLTQWFRKATADAGLPAGLPPHGLRKAAARRLAEAGCSSKEIAAITGHATLREIERYSAGADQKRLAESAMDKLSRTDREQKLSTRIVRLDKNSSKLLKG